ncbi:unnamed protein product [Chondrus crispus]|uniref:Zinc-finger domain-containing protein n=1 Tax=Chondrus crispus TaxID=2769 RepID=R7QPB7_CHOCR|nr:unnamed protein product [Chondrus crispus]CDF39613.1 unnamed protein product [Chondrus crispus]|eukprot:XP_005709907.1 unnamed protein product [Chondrus crispus]
MDNHRDHVAFEHRDATFFVDNLFNSTPSAVETADFKFIDKWIETAINEPQTPLPAPAETLPYLELDDHTSKIPADLLSAPLPRPASSPNQTARQSMHSTPVSYAKEERFGDEIQPNNAHLHRDEIQPSLIPVSPPIFNAHLPLLGHHSGTPMHASKDTPALVSALHRNPPAELAFRALSPASLPYPQCIREPGLLPHSCYEDSIGHDLHSPAWATQAQTGTPPLSPNFVPATPQNAFNAGHIPPSYMSPGYISPAHLSPGHFAAPGLIPFPRVATHGIAPMQRIGAPEHSGLMVYNTAMTATSADPSLMHRVPSALSVESSVTQASGQVGIQEAPQAATKSKNRYSKGASASNYCHVCGRNSRIEFAVCANTKVGLCRKVVCDKCLLLYERESFVTSKDPRVKWKCTHCRNCCPPRARCKQYTRNNHRRRARKAAAALREAQNRQLAAQAAQAAQASQQGHQPPQMIPPNLLLPTMPLVQGARVVKPKRQRKSRRKGQQKGTKRGRVKPEPSRRPEVALAPTQPMQWLLGENTSLFLGHEAQPGVPPLVGPSTPQVTVATSPMMVGQMVSPLPAPDSRGQERDFCHLAQSPNIDSVLLPDQLPMRAAGPSMQYLNLEAAEPASGAGDGSGKRRRVVEPFPDGISPVSIANMVMADKHGKSPFAEDLA